MLKKSYKSYKSYKSCIVVLLLLTGCASQAPAPVYLLLDQPAISESGAIGAIGRVDVKVSSYLQQPQLAIATGKNRVQFSDNYLWAEPLDSSLTAILRQQLEQVAPVLSLSASSGERENSVDVLVRRLNVRPDGQVQMTGEYTVSVGTNKTRHRFNLLSHTGTTSYPDMVNSIQGLAGQLAKEIADTF